MNNHRTPRARVTALLLTLALCLALVPAAGAADSAQTVYLDSAADFAAFAKNCSLDTWSQGKTVILRADISLSGVDFTPAASFGGTFEGRGHTISDFNLTQNASPAGLFGTILPGGRVANLNVAGSVAAGGDKIACGGIAGENYGRIVCCTFTGMVQGDTQIGGIVGRNQASGQIVSCSFEGKVQGTTATGGIAGHGAEPRAGRTAAHLFGVVPEGEKYIGCDLLYIGFGQRLADDAANNGADIRAVAVDEPQQRLL